MLSLVTCFYFPSSWLILEGLVVGEIQAGSLQAKPSFWGLSSHTSRVLLLLTWKIGEKAPSSALSLPPPTRQGDVTRALEEPGDWFVPGPEVLTPHHPHWKKRYVSHSLLNVKASRLHAVYGWEVHGSEAAWREGFWEAVVTQGPLKTVP